MDLDDLTRLSPLLIVPLLLRWLARNKRPAAAREGEAYVMRYGRVWRALSWGGFVLPATFAVMPLFVPVHPRELRLVTVVGVALLLAALAWVFEVYGRVVRLTDRGIEGRSPFFKRKTVALRWSELSAIVYLPGSQSLELRDREGRRVRVSRYFEGFATLAAHLERYGAPQLANAAVMERVRALV